MKVFRGFSGSSRGSSFVAKAFVDNWRLIILSYLIAITNYLYGSAPGQRRHAALIASECGYRGNKL